MADHSASLRFRIVALARDLELRPGERLGSERELAERLGTSRAVLRLALDGLAADGVIRRSMGRTGGVLLDDGRIERNLNTIQGVPMMLRQQGFEPSTELLHSGISMASPAERRNLGLADSENVLRIIRLRLADGVPWSLDSSVLPASLFPGLLSGDLTGSLYALMEQRYRVRPAEADETFDTVLADEEQAGLLRVSAGAPLIQIWRVTRGQDDTAIEFAHDHFRADRTRIHLRRYRSSWKRPPVTQR